MMKQKTKEKFDRSAYRALIKKQSIERIYPYKKGNFDIAGTILRLAVLTAIIAAFVIFFGKFIDMYIKIKTDNAVNVNKRLGELITIIYAAVILFMTFGAVGQIGREIFLSEDVRLFSAMPIKPAAVYWAKVTSVYFGQLLFSMIATLTVSLTLSAHADLGAFFFITSFLMCFFLPVISIAIASIVAIPFYAVRGLLKGKFVLNFVIVTLITAALFVLYYFLLGGIKELLLGDSIKFFFNERVMNAIMKFCACLYPAVWISDLLIKTNVGMAILGIACTLIVCTVASTMIIRLILSKTMRSMTPGYARFMGKKRNMGKENSVMNALIKKEFLTIFRSPSYMFSYFSVAIIMPLMIFACMDIGSALITRLIGIDCNFELALFLTLLFGSLTNIFCATNISRDGMMFYTVKAMPISGKKVFLSKVLLCMAVALLSQFISAVALAAFGLLPWYNALVLFVAGSLFSFVHVAVSTRYDFDHARFSTDEDGEIKEAGGTVSVIIMLGLILSVLVGGLILGIRMLLLIRNIDYSYLTYIILFVAAIGFSALAYFYFIGRLSKKYYEFEGGI